eukprot:CAMPEP_0115210730 /NCGR_PEP_ID=MMETSP0270-20121206/22397_1 /TAXON_ID=71861 /ORGANISM="Scrippsiella trochoidea, Strain CCMP3099" /LENGTH=216 /DNA_ID=CAMNT_0002624393 /DNA_START=72 /DNA_END=722 /DNA_ORIENTATION=+
MWVVHPAERSGRFGQKFNDFQGLAAPLMQMLRKFRGRPAEAFSLCFTGKQCFMSVLGAWQQEFALDMDYKAFVPLPHPKLQGMGRHRCLERTYTRIVFERQMPDGEHSRISFEVLSGLTPEEDTLRIVGSAGSKSIETRLCRACAADHQRLEDRIGYALCGRRMQVRPIARMPSVPEEEGNSDCLPSESSATRPAARKGSAGGARKADAHACGSLV